MMRSANGPVLFDDADRLTDAIIGRTGKNLVLALPLGLGKANHVANSIFNRAAGDPSIALRIFTALTLGKPRAKRELERRFLEPISARLFDDYPSLAYSEALLENRLPPNIEVNEFFFLAGSRLNVPAAQRNYISANYTHALSYVLDRKVNVVGQLVAKRVRDGKTCYSLSCNPDITLDLLAARRAAQANFVLVGQVNSELPYMPGDAELSPEEFDFFLEGPQSEFPLFAPPREPVDLSEYAAGFHVARMIADGGTIQLGIGSLGDAVAQALILRHRKNSEFRDIGARLAPFISFVEPLEDMPFMQGVYGVSEMFVESFLDLYRANILKREVNGALLRAAFFVGSKAFYQALREMPDAERAKFQMTAVSYVNELYGDEAAKRSARIKSRFINNGMMATLLGAVISDGLEDGKVVSGVGGQYNFVAQSFALADARSIIMVRATRNAKGRVTSNILWKYGHATIPRHLRDVVVTEYGIADLRGKTDRDVIAAMLSIADSRFQSELVRQAKDSGKIENGFELPAACRENTPERIETALRTAYDSGLIPPFPFGTDFTQTEQRLIPALTRLSSASSIQLIGFLLRGLGSKSRFADTQDCLDRMGLARPRGLVESIYAAVLRGCLRSRRIA
jgi:Acetyl-CoA hydrolase/transferase C-terminal domain